jgi:radical SAM superfamily enzyme YgiQ (UPF0313 family)
MKILLVSPKTPKTFWSFDHALRFVSKRAAFPPLGLLTVAGMLPEDWELQLRDLNLEPLRDADLDWADYVLTGGMIVHRDSVREIAARCLQRQRTLIGGGPLFTTGHEDFPEIPHFVLGEAEEIMPRVIEHMRRGQLLPVYEAPGFPDIHATPPPRWDLIRLRDYASMCVQFSRGCPFDCEFCDIVVMNGRVPRTKRPEQVVCELEGLRARGWKGSVFIVDDNFIGNRRRVKELLTAMLVWRRRSAPRMTFLTEASINLAADAELMATMVDVGFKRVFLGIETPEESTLEQCHKLQNTKLDLMAAVKRIQNAGLEVMGGFIVGFDGDPKDIFQRQFQFIQRAGVVTAMVGLLTALPKTRLYKRLQREGRLLATTTGNNTEAICNFTPRLDRDDLIAGYRRLMRRLYEPRAYYQRARTFLAEYHNNGPKNHLGRSEVGAFLKAGWLLGLRHHGRRQFWQFVAHTLCTRPRAFAPAITLAIYGHHFRRIAQSL